MSLSIVLVVVLLLSRLFFLVALRLKILLGTLWSATISIRVTVTPDEVCEAPVTDNDNLPVPEEFDKGIEADPLIDHEDPIVFEYLPAFPVSIDGVGQGI